MPLVRPKQKGLLPRHPPKRLAATTTTIFTRTSRHPVAASYPHHPLVTTLIPLCGSPRKHLASRGTGGGGTKATEAGPETRAAAVHGDYFVAAAVLPEEVKGRVGAETRVSPTLPFWHPSLAIPGERTAAGPTNEPPGLPRLTEPRQPTTRLRAQPPRLPRLSPRLARNCSPGIYGLR